MAEGAFAAFLANGTLLLEWIVDSTLNLITSLMGNPVTAAFLILGLIGIVFTTYRVVTNR